MRPCSGRPFGLYSFCLFGALLSTLQPPVCEGQTKPLAGSLASSLVQRAQEDLGRIEWLVQQGTLPQSRLAEAQEHLEDVQDSELLSETLYAPLRIEEMTDAQADSMAKAAERRVGRQQAIVDKRKELVTDGILAPAELAVDQQELDSRKRVLQLAKNRRTLIYDLRQMALTEERLQDAASRDTNLSKVMIRFDGSAAFTPRDLSGIATRFAKQFGRNLPVSATGQTMVHESLGLDHRNRVDVALNPESPEGVWLRGQLEKQHIPYLAFRTAVIGAATGPHIHIGTASSRLRIVQSLQPHG